jgi:hypothetical protein
MEDAAVWGYDAELAKIGAVHELIKNYFLAKKFCKS